jgi:hypothetical protein
MNNQLTRAVNLLDKVQSFNGHGDLYSWYNDPETQKLMDEIREFVKEAQHENSNL